VTVKDKAAILRHELDELRDQISSLEKSLEEKPDYGLGKGAPSVTRWELDQSLLQRLKEQAAGLVRTLSQMGEGTYGTCERCGRPIHPDRLAILPSTKICVRCARSEEQEQAS
jgi:RNA polymerase-binding transcription factor DksA